MKPSHFTTPRSRAEGVWRFDADPIERPEHQAHGHIGLALIAALGWLVAALLIAIGTRT